jgi:hypothetical protein
MEWKRGDQRRLWMLRTQITSNSGVLRISTICGANVNTVDCNVDAD